MMIIKKNGTVYIDSTVTDVIQLSSLVRKALIAAD